MQRFFFRNEYDGAFFNNKKQISFQGECFEDGVLRGVDRCALCRGFGSFYWRGGGFVRCGFVRCWGSFGCLFFGKAENKRKYSDAEKCDENDETLFQREGLKTKKEATHGGVGCFEKRGRKTCYKGSCFARHRESGVSERLEFFREFEVCDEIARACKGGAKRRSCMFRMNRNGPFLRRRGVLFLQRRVRFG